MASEMMERVAKAIFATKTLAHYETWEEISKGLREEYLKAAHAAIKAMADD